jgi:hypothetical protein
MPVRFGLLLVLAAFFAVGCAEGSYPVDIFYEMHYQPSHHSQQPPRLMPPTGSVPITGKEVPLFAQVHPDEIDTIENPMPEQGIEEGAMLYAINCSMCHGMDALGDGQVLQTMIENYAYTPKLNVNLSLVHVLGYSDGLLYATISNRDLRPEIADLNPGAPIVMPQFEKLLTSEERWMLVNYLNTLGGP